MNVFIQLFPPLGFYLGPTFSLTPNVGTATPSTATKDELLNGIDVVLSDSSATTVEITSLGNVCSNSIILPVSNQTTTTSTTSTTTIAPPTTTSTTTVALPTTTTTTSNQSIQAVIEISFGFGDPWVNLQVDVLSGTTLSNISFTGVVSQHATTTCSLPTNGPDFNVSSFTLTAGSSSTVFDLVNSWAGGTQSLNLKSLVVGGVTVVSSPQVVTIGGNNYQIIGYGTCVI